MFLRERADDVILFNPGDLERPMGLNLLEAHTEEQKNLFLKKRSLFSIKLYGEEIVVHVLALVSKWCVDACSWRRSRGATLLDITKLFTDVGIWDGKTSSEESRGEKLLGKKK